MIHLLSWAIVLAAAALFFFLVFLIVRFVGGRVVNEGVFTRHR